MRMEEGLDTGPYCLQGSVPVDEMNASTLTAELGVLGAELLLAALPDIVSGTAVWTSQDEAEVTYAEKVTKADVAPSPRLSARNNMLRVRASTSAAPARILIGGKGLTVLEASTYADDSLAPGAVRLTDDGVLVGTASGSMLIVRLKPDGKGEMEAAAWARGARLVGRHRLGECAMSASPARKVAREVVTRVRERSAYAHELMDSALRAAKLSPADAALATRLAYGTLQAEGTLIEAIDRYLGGKRVEPRISDALRVSAYEILFMRSEKRAAVHQGVELVREVRKQAAGLANAVLRRLAEDASSFPWGDPKTDVRALARMHAHPVWLANLWVEELGRETAEQVMAANNTPAPLYLAANTFAGTVDAAREGLRADGALPRAGHHPRMHRGG